MWFGTSAVAANIVSVYPVSISSFLFWVNLGFISTRELSCPSYGLPTLPLPGHSACHTSLTSTEHSVLLPGGVLLEVRFSSPLKLWDLENNSELRQALRQ